MGTPPEERVTRSADGTPIGFLKLGSGPPLVFVHGSVNTGDEWLQVATAMAEQFMCYVMDRRGRGRSGDASAYSLDRECEDIIAVLEVAGPDAHLLGHSYGAICALETAGRFPIGRLVVYEPPLPVDGPVPGKTMEAYRAAVESNKLDQALTIFLKDIVHVTDPELATFGATPLWKKMAALTPTLTRELETVDRLEPSLERYRQLAAPTLSLRGTATQAMHKAASNALENTLPDVRTAQFAGEGHVANLTAPGMVAKEVTDFLLVRS